MIEPHNIPYCLFRYSPHNEKRGLSVCSAHSITVWVAKGCHMKDSWVVWKNKIQSLDVQWRVGENWCWCLLNWLKVGVVTANEQFSHTHHTPLGALTICGLSQRAGLILSNWEVAQMNIPSLLMLFFQKKDGTKGLIFQDSFKEKTVGGCWHCM